jgi:hypothetical protein
LEVLHWDKSADLRERAACNLADSGMLTRELRREAVPDLIRFGQDESLDAMTRKWSFQALREITGQNLPDNANAWVRWRATRRSTRPRSTSDPRRLDSNFEHRGSDQIESPVVVGTIDALASSDSARGGRPDVQIALPGVKA